MADRTRGDRDGFTLLEVLVAAAVLAMMLTLVLGVIGQTGDITRRASAKITSFQEARAGFETMSQNLSQATINSYWNFDDPVTPTRYRRYSELHFVVGESGVAPFPGTPGTGQAVAFQAPAGLTANAAEFGRLGLLLNAAGYFVEYGAEPPLPSPFPPSSMPRHRYRLMQAVQPAESLAVYNTNNSMAWISGLTGSGSQVEPVAENIVHLILWPRYAPMEDPEGTRLTGGFGGQFAYDSRSGEGDNPQPVHAHQLPPVLQVTMVAIDEPSAARLCTEATPPPQIVSAFNGLFQSASQESFDNDMQTLEKRLAETGVNFRVFTTLVPLRESKML